MNDDCLLNAYFSMLCMHDAYSITQAKVSFCPSGMDIYFMDALYIHSIEGVVLLFRFPISIFYSSLTIYVFNA